MVGIGSVGVGLLESVANKLGYGNTTDNKHLSNFGNPNMADLYVDLTVKNGILEV